ncbi:hypothetical protein B0A78_13870 [Flavobacterium columnare NBRC 100251 = ATCC 23463]|uniref:C-type lysozyme inhibitor domain-containing protein n=1 Tax=Flavobacterium columnare (strain ATCC 49512 / CIP 103533 / TG 44/87) TaxID=1041826 RepID=G8X932_FLACA|nr:hypothetical protein [Flavobacterium columnare]AEW85083.1 hypothetical protein FCOL_01170 [Flavobacterium columnare ATCC 49512]ANO49139.1 hypothetical protein Pf1_00891 [Flavobacterium columnare]APT22865.1 hypothetical protein BU993_09720 [Flavobacterium columnare]MBF6652745.1 hypothetical protein [Flavobacterium columnare]MBF6654563.1 hypothetical protein [Flavobacterium columnare]
MKKLTLSLGLLLCLLSCKKEVTPQTDNTSKNDTLSKVDTTTAEKTALNDEAIEKASNTYIYKALDGKNYSIYHTEKEGKRVAIISLDEKELVILPQKEAWAKGAIYQDNKYNLECNGDNAILKIDNKDQKLVLISPINTVAINGKDKNDQIELSYINTEKINLLRITKSGKTTIYNQIEAWSKGANYTNGTDTIQCEGNKNPALIKIKSNGIETDYFQK